MDETLKEKGPGTTQDAKPSQNTSTSVREVQKRSKLLVVLFDGYAKVYCDSPASMHVVTVPSCDTAGAERQALEQAEAGIPLLYRHLVDETLLVGSLTTAVPTLSQLVESEGMLLGLRSIEEAARRSVASKKARRAKQ